MREYDHNPLNRPIRLLLERERGAKLSSRQVTEKLDLDPGPFLEPSDAMREVIRALAQLEQMGVVRYDVPTHTRAEITWWIEPPKDGARA